jgi:hypothetical protein
MTREEGISNAIMKLATQADNLYVQSNPLASRVELQMEVRSVSLRGSNSDDVGHHLTADFKTQENLITANQSNDVNASMTVVCS